MPKIMAENKKSFLMYCDWIELFEGLPDEMAGKLIKHIYKYTNDQDPQSDDLVLNTAFTLIKQQLKRDLVKYEGIRAKNKESALKRWHPDASERIPNDAKNADTDIVTVTDTDKDKVNDKKKERVKRFTPPARSDVYDYMFLKGMTDDRAMVQSEKFINHYTSNGWMVGKNKMKDWQAAVRSNWLKDVSSNGQTEYTYKEVLYIHGDAKDRRTMENFEIIEGTKKWKAK